MLVLLAAACGGGSDPTVVTTTPTPVITPPGPPTSLLATAGNATVRLTFGAPASDGGAPVTSYLASCAASGAAAQSASAGASPIIVAGLTNGVTYTCTVAAVNTRGTGTPASSAAIVPIAPVATGAFRGSVVLGSPTATSIKANVYAADQSGTVSIWYGTTPGIYDAQTPSVTLTAKTPLEIALNGLRANTRYYYQLNYTTSGTGSGPTAEASFITARPPGSTFVFGVQGDSHPERVRIQFDSTFYVTTLTTAAADKPDFYIMLGDDFSVDQIPGTVTNELVADRYRLQRPYLGIIGRSAPVFLVNGNHEQAARYLLDGTPNNVAVWAQNARNAHYSQPAPDGFYTGNTEIVPFIGLLRNYYAWQWGDALFVTIDPYWTSSVAVDNTFGGDTKRANLWDITHGDAQYQWLKTTLEKSTAKYKFVFAHHVMGTQRGGIEIAKEYEWGGEDGRGVNQFAANRPAWPLPIHQLFVNTKVTAFFQGHDHIWVHQQLDGVTYQEVSEPADPNYSLFNADAYLTGDKFPNSGYTRVTVSPTGVKVEYVRTYLSADVGPGKTNGSVTFSYSIP